MHASKSDAFAGVKTAYAVAGVDVTAGGTGDATEVDCDYVDTQGLGSLKAVVVYTATLAAAATLSITANFQEDADGNGVGTDYGAALAATVVATGPEGGGTVKGTVELDLRTVAGADRYLRLQFTPNLSAADTDVAELAAIYVLGGATDGVITRSLI